MLDMTPSEIAYCWNLLKLLRRALKREVDFPALIELQTINRCNASCPMCPYPQTIGKQDFYYMSDDLYENILRQLANESSFGVLILSFQNEPFLDKNLFARARRFKELMPGKELHIVTNGSMLHRESAPEVFRWFDTVSISVNAASKRTYELVMRDLSWEKTKANLDYIASNKAWVDKTVLRFIRQEANAGETSEFKRHWNERGFRVFGFETNSRLGTVPDYNRIKIHDTPTRSARKYLLRFLGRILIPTCPIPFLSFFIRADGNVVLCFNYYSDKHHYGNVQKTPIRTIFNSPKYQQVRANALNDTFPDEAICRACDLYYEGIYLTV